MAVAYITPASDWSTSGAVNVSFQVFNPGPTYLTSGAPKIKAVDGIQFNMQSTAVVVAQQYPASAGQTLSSSIAGSVTIPALSPFSPVTKTTTDAASSFGEYAGSYNVNAGSPGNFNYQVLPTTDLNANTSGVGGDIMNWRIAPTVAGAAAGDRIYVSDFYKTSVSGVYAGFHIIGINGASSFVGAQAANIIYTTPEPGTWAAIVGIGAALGWQLCSRRRSATATAAATVTG